MNTYTSDGRLVSSRKFVGVSPKAEAIAAEEAGGRGRNAAHTRLSRDGHVTIRSRQGSRGSFKATIIVAR